MSDDLQMTDAAPAGAVSPCDERRGRPSASGLQRIALCPGSWNAGLQCGPGGSSADADDGTRLHKHMEEGTTPADAEEAEAVQWCRDTEEELVRRALGVADMAEATVVRERRYWCSAPVYSGQADLIAIHGDKAVVADYKFGRGEVPDILRNLQIAALAVLVFQEFPDVERIYGAILQPFVSRAFPQTVLYERAGAEYLKEAISGVIRRAEAPDAPLVAGAYQCKYCPAAPTCHAASLQVGKVASADLTAWNDWPAEKKLQAWELAQLAKKWAEKVEGAVKEDLKAGAPIPGLELGAGRTAFTILNPQAAFDILSADLGVTAGEFVGCCKVQMTQLDSVVHSKLKSANPKQTVRESKEYLRVALGDVAEAKTTEGTVKRNDNFQRTSERR